MHLLQSAGPAVTNGLSLEVTSKNTGRTSDSDCQWGAAAALGLLCGCVGAPGVLLVAWLLCSWGQTASFPCRGSGQDSPSWGDCSSWLCLLLCPRQRCEMGASQACLLSAHMLPGVATTPQKIPTSSFSILLLGTSDVLPGLRGGADTSYIHFPSARG